MKKMIILVTMFFAGFLPTVALSQHFREVPGNNTQTDTLLAFSDRYPAVVLRKFPWKAENSFFTQIQTLLRQPGGDYPQGISVGIVFYNPRSGNWEGGVGVAEYGWRIEERIVPWNGTTFQQVSWELTNEQANYIREAYTKSVARDSLQLRLVFSKGNMEIAANSDGEPIIWFTDAIPPEPPILREVAPPDTTWYEGQGLAVTMHLEVEVPNDTLSIIWEATNHGQMIVQQVIQPISPKIGQEAGTARNLEVVLQPLPLPILLEVKAKSVWTVRPTVNLYSIWSDSIQVEYIHRQGWVYIPENFILHQNYPNPFNPNTTIEYKLPQVALIKLIIYNMLGQEVRILVDEQKPAGEYSVIWDSTDQFGQRVASGVYIYRLQAVSNGNRFAETKKMTLLK